MAKEIKTGGLGYMPSKRVYDFIKEMEGGLQEQKRLGHFRRGRFYLYNDSAAHTTIGYGHKLTRKEIASGRFRDGLSPQEADNLFKEDIRKAVLTAEQHFGEKGWSLMQQEQKDAAIDFAYNLGASGLKQFPRWSKALRVGDWKTVEKEAKRNYKDSRTKAWEPLSRRNAAYHAAFISPNLLKDEVAAERETTVTAQAETEEEVDEAFDMKLIRTLAKHTDKNFVKRILRPEKYPKLDVGKDPEGNQTYSTHQMAWGEKGDKYIAFPTVVQRGEGKGLEKIEGPAIWDYLKETGEFIEFDTPEEAEDFSKNYKKIWDYRGLWGNRKK